MTLAEYDGPRRLAVRAARDRADAWGTLTADVKHSIQVIGGGLGRLEELPEWTLDAVKEALQDQLHIMGRPPATS